MKVTHLFAVGKSIRTVKDQPSPYRMTDALPKLRVEKGNRSESPESRGTDSEVLARPVDPAEVEGSEAAASVSVEDSDLQEVAATKKVPRVLPGWSVFRRYLAKSAGQNEQFVQPELSLETVRVMRNDLSEHAAVQVIQSKQFRSKQTITVAGHWWTRLQRRLFARARKQD
jgi:hypothetical protein